MGFRYFNVFNLSLLAKKVWRQLIHPNSLVARIFKSKYFLSGNLLQLKAGPNSSFAWRSLLWGIKLVVRGVRWRVGNGYSIKVFNDTWILRPRSFRQSLSMMKLRSISELRTSLVYIGNEIDIRFLECCGCGC